MFMEKFTAAWNDAKCSPEPDTLKQRHRCYKSDMWIPYGELLMNFVVACVRLI